MFTGSGSKAVLAARKPSEQPYAADDDFKHYLLKEELDALINDAHHSSYWKKQFGTTHDLTLLPAGFDMQNATFGKHKTVNEYGSDCAYDLTCPKDTPIAKTSPLLDPGYQTDRHYRRPPYDPNESFGMACTHRDTKCSVTNEGMVLGTGFLSPRAALSTKQDVGECFSYSTTYNDMMRPGQGVDKKPMAGLPSARYVDEDEVCTPALMCKADLICHPEESDVRSCISPSNFTHFAVNHRDLYAKRSPKVVRELFEAAGENFTDKGFSELWDEAKKYHSLGWVCYATFKKALDNKTNT